MSHWMVYWWVMLDRFSHGAFAFAFLSAMAIGVLIIAWIGLKRENKPAWKNCRLATFLIIPFFIIMVAIASFLPSTKQFAVIYLAPKIVNNEDVREMAGDGMRLMKLKLGKWLEEQMPEEGISGGE